MTAYEYILAMSTIAGMCLSFVAVVLRMNVLYRNLSDKVDRIELRTRMDVSEIVAKPDVMDMMDENREVEDMIDYRGRVIVPTPYVPTPYVALLKTNQRRNPPG